MNATPVWSAPVRYGECDQQGVVFNAHYLLYCDEAMAAFCVARDLRSLIDDVRLVTSTLTWTAPARYGDTISIEVSCAQLGTSSFELDFAVLASDKPCCTVRTRYVYTDPDTDRSRPIPTDMRDKLS